MLLWPWRMEKGNCALPVVVAAVGQLGQQLVVAVGDAVEVGWPVVDVGATEIAAQLQPPHSLPVAVGAVVDAEPLLLVAEAVEVVAVVVVACLLLSGSQPFAGT